MIDAGEAATCDQQRFDAATGGQEEMTQELGAAYPDAREGGSDVFGEDPRGRQRLDQCAEWTSWREPRFGDATRATGGEMPSADYGTWERGGSATD